MEKAGFDGGAVGLTGNFLTVAPNPGPMDRRQRNCWLSLYQAGRPGAKLPTTVWRWLPKSCPLYNRDVCLWETLRFCCWGFQGHENFQSWKRNKTPRPFLC